VPAAPDALRARAGRLIEAAQALRVALRGGSAAGGTGAAGRVEPIEPLLAQLYAAVRAATSLPTAEQCVLAGRAQAGLRARIPVHDRLVGEEAMALGRPLEAAGLRWNAPARIGVPALVPLPEGATR